jgi:predicted  nucleic acid-binding Zn-ribbon protein
VENIVNSLFADYLPRRQQEPVGVVDPRQQTMLTNQMLTPVMNKPTKPSQKVPVFPSIGGIGGGTVPTQPPAAPVSDQTLTPVMPKPTPPTEEAPEFASVGGIGGGVVPTAEETTEPVAYDPSNINLAALENINTGGFDITDLGLFQEGGIADDVFKGLDITQRDEVNPDAWVDIFNSYSDFLGSVESGDTANKVNRRDDIYNDWQKQNIKGKYSGDLSALRAAIGLSDAFSVYDTAGSTITNESLEGAYKTLTSGESFQKVLADYYGFDFQPATNEGANYTNAAKYGTDAQRMAEFQSLVEPILQKSIPYIQATQGLNYTDALEYAYTHDPMLNALYQSYGVDLYRQTKDGSTYIYDPIAGQEIRTLEVKDAKFKDYLPAIAAIGLAFTGIPTALGTALGASGTTATALGGALISGTSTLIQGGNLKDALKGAIVSGITAGVSGDLTDAVGKALGVSKDIAAGITQAGLAAAQGAGSEEALLSGFLAGASSYIQGEMPAANQDFEQFGGDVDAVNPQGFVNTATTRAETKAATDAIKTAATQNPAATMGETLVIAQRNNPNIAADVLKSAAQQVASGAVTPKGGMLTKDTPAGDVEEVIVTPTDDVRYTMPTKDGAIIQTATKLTATPFGQQFLTGVQTVDPAGHNEILKQIEAGADSITWRGRTILVSDLMGATKTTTQAPEIVSKEPKQPEGASLPDKPTAEDVEPQPDLPLEEDMEIPEFEIENLPPDFNAEIPEVVTPPVTPETPVVPRPNAGGGGGSAGGVVVPPPATPPPAAPEAPTDEVVDVFDDGGLTGDAFDDSTTGGAEGGAAEDVAVDVTDTEEYRDLQEELNTTRANQETLETTVAGLQDEVAAANAAAKQAQEAATAAEAAGAANADKLRGEAVAAQANAERVQNELDTANEALGSANSTIESLQTKLGTTQQERDAAKKEVTELTKTLDTTKADVETKTKEINTLNTTVSTLNKDVDKLNTELKNANNTVKDIQEELNKAKETNATNVKDLEQKLADAKSKATTTKENLDSKTKELETANGTIKTLTSEVDTANSTIKDLNKQLETKQSEIESTKAELGTAKESNVELTKELEKTNTEVATLEGKLSTVKETNTDLTKRLEDSNTKVGELNENLSSAKEDLASLKDEYAEAVVSNKKNVDSLEKKVKSKESEIKGLEKNIKDADSTVKSLEGEISKNKQEITGLEDSLSEALKAVSGLESSLAESEAATKAAIAKGIADAEAAREAGFGEGYGEGEGAGLGKGLGKGLGAGAGLGSAIGLLGGFGMGQAQGGGGVPYTRPEAKDFMAKLNFNLPEAERVQQQQLQDYVGMLLGNMR